MPEFLINHSERRLYSDAAFYIGQEGDHKGILTYEPTENGIELLWLSSNVEGGGKALIKHFCETFGHGISVFGHIREKETWHKLIQLGYVHKALYIDPLRVPPDSGIYPQLKIWRVLSGGGIQKIEFTFTKGGVFENTPLTLNFTGNT
jgi:hypothetical protein